MRGKRENFFSREKKFSLSPRAPLSLSRKAGKLFYLPLPTRVGNSAFCFAGGRLLPVLCPARLRLLCNSTPRQAKHVLYPREKDHPPLLGILRILGILGILWFYRGGIVCRTQRVCAEALGFGMSHADYRICITQPAQNRYENRVCAARFFCLPGITSMRRS